MPVAQKFLAGLTGLGALYLVVMNPKGAYSAAKGIQGLTAGSVAQVISGGKRGALK